MKRGITVFFTVNQAFGNKKDGPKAVILKIFLSPKYPYNTSHIHVLDQTCQRVQKKAPSWVFFRYSLLRGVIQYHSVRDSKPD
jgi:hypothetical protein